MTAFFDKNTEGCVFFNKIIYFCIKIEIKMTITVELPENKKEAAFVLQLLQRLNLVFKKQEPIVDDLPDELKALLEERLDDLEKNPHDVILWEDIKQRSLQTLTV